jgi:hypothetical protein
MTCSTSRILKILNAADELLRRIIDWAQDPHGHLTVPNNVQVAFVKPFPSVTGENCPIPAARWVPLPSVDWPRISRV